VSGAIFTKGYCTRPPRQAVCVNNRPLYLTFYDYSANSITVNIPWKKYKNPLAVFLFCIALTFLLTIFGEKGLLTLRTMKAERDVIALQVRQLETDNGALREEIKRLKTDRKYIASIARRELGMIGKNEVIYRFKE